MYSQSHRSLRMITVIYSIITNWFADFISIILVAVAVVPTFSIRCLNWDFYRMNSWYYFAGRNEYDIVYHKQYNWCDWALPTIQIKINTQQNQCEWNNHRVIQLSNFNNNNNNNGAIHTKWIFFHAFDRYLDYTRYLSNPTLKGKEMKEKSEGGGCLRTHLTHRIS